MEDDEFESGYTAEGRQNLVKNDEMEPEEQAFMEGYSDEGEEEQDESDDEEYEKAFEGSEEE